MDVAASSRCPNTAPPLPMPHLWVFGQLSAGVAVRLATLAGASGEMPARCVRDSARESVWSVWGIRCAAGPSRAHAQ